MLYLRRIDRRRLEQTRTRFAAFGRSQAQETMELFPGLFFEAPFSAPQF